jgi:catechol 2,3-dioxygenase-like lactoylglutathione lyase family enzyme
MALGQTIVSANHVSYTVVDILRALRLFTQLLSADVLSHARAANMEGIRGMTGLDVESLEIAFVQLGEQRIELLQFTPAKSEVQLAANTPGFAHLAITVSDLDAFLIAARSFELVPIGSSMKMLGGSDVGKRAIYLRSPDAIVVEAIGA